MNRKTDAAAAGAGHGTMIEDFRETVLEARRSYSALGLLVGLLKGETEASLSVMDREGMAVLLECIQSQLDLSIQGMGLTARALGMPDAERLVDWERGSYG